MNIYEREREYPNIFKILFHDKIIYQLSFN